MHQNLTRRLLQIDLVKRPISIFTYMLYLEEELKIPLNDIKKRENLKKTEELKSKINKLDEKLGRLDDKKFKNLEIKYKSANLPFNSYKLYDIVKAI